MQAWLIPHTNKVTQQISNKVGKLQTGCIKLLSGTTKTAGILLLTPKSNTKNMSLVAQKYRERRTLGNLGQPRLADTLQGHHSIHHANRHLYTPLETELYYFTNKENNGNMLPPNLRQVSHLKMKTSSLLVFKKEAKPCFCLWVMFILPASHIPVT